MTFTELALRVLLAILSIGGVWYVVSLHHRQRKAALKSEPEDRPKKRLADNQILSKARPDPKVGRWKPLRIPLPAQQFGATYARDWCNTAAYTYEAPADVLWHPNVIQELEQGLLRS